MDSGSPKSLSGMLPDVRHRQVTSWRLMLIRRRRLNPTGVVQPETGAGGQVGAIVGVLADVGVDVAVPVAALLALGVAVAEAVDVLVAAAL